MILSPTTRRAIPIILIFTEPYLQNHGCGTEGNECVFVPRLSSRPRPRPSTPTIGGLFWSENSGTTWTMRSLKDASVSSLALDCADGKIIYAIYKTYGIEQDTLHFARSEDSGLTWTDIYSAQWSRQNNDKVLSIAASRTTPGELYAAIAPWFGETGAIWQSKDYGETWELVMDNVPRLNIIRSGSLYAAMNGGLYKKRGPTELLPTSVFHWILY